jgi:hypothetical protein
MDFRQFLPDLDNIKYGIFTYCFCVFGSVMKIGARGLYFLYGHKLSYTYICPSNRMEFWKHITPLKILHLTVRSGGRHLQSCSSRYVTMVYFPRDLGMSVRSDCSVSFWGTLVLRWSISFWLYFVIFWFQIVQ